MRWIDEAHVRYNFEASQAVKTMSKALWGSYKGESPTGKYQAYYEENAIIQRKLHRNIIAVPWVLHGVNGKISWRSMTVE